MATPKLTVCLTFDFDAVSLWIASGSNNPATISRGEFGPFAIRRILELLRDHDVKATFFVPGHTALAFPDQVQAIQAEGHEIGHHGWVHENPANLDREGEVAVFERALEALDEVVGVRPVGYRSPAADFSVNTIGVLREHGIAYDSSCSGTDFTPYYLRVGDQWSLTEPYVFGDPVDVVELPFSWGLDDFPHFEFEVGWSTDQNPPSVVREIWQAEFDYALAHAPGGIFDIAMHPQVIGRGSRLMMLSDLVEYMKSQDGVEFATMADYAKRWRSANPLEEWVRANPTTALPPRGDQGDRGA
jgi:peptidoglycan-N-acetylglucosamine deacetylase